MLRHAETQTEPPGRSQRIHQNAITLRITFYRVEQHSRRAAPLVDNVRDTADFQIPIGAFDGPDLAELISLFEPTSQTIWLFHQTKPLNTFKPFNRFARFKPFKLFSPGILRGILERLERFERFEPIYFLVALPSTVANPARAPTAFHLLKPD